jgi:restriction system protein
MKGNEKVVWGIHAGKTGDAHSLFMGHNVVALGWSKLGDLSKINADRNAFKEAVSKAFPEKKAGAIPNNAGQLYRFIYEMQVGHYVVYASKEDRQVHIGRVVGEYRYDSNTERGYPHLRAVKWLRSFPRTHFSQPALYEIGAAMSFFQVKNYAEEFVAALEGKVGSSVVAKDESFGNSELEELARDQIARLILAKLKGHGLALLVDAILKAEGYTTYRSPEGPDGGVDILAGAGPLGFGSPRLCVQVKSQDSPVGRPEIDQLQGAMKKFQAQEALFVSWGGFKQNVYKEVSSSFFSLRLWTQTELLEKLFLHYDQLEEDLKAELPLKQIWTVAVQEEE